jgi:hypothetical protein
VNDKAWQSGSRGFSAIERTDKRLKISANSPGGAPNSSRISRAKCAWSA